MIHTCNQHSGNAGLWACVLDWTWHDCTLPWTMSNTCCIYNECSLCVCLFVLDSLKCKSESRTQVQHFQMSMWSKMYNMFLADQWYWSTEWYSERQLSLGVCEMWSSRSDSSSHVTITRPLPTPRWIHWKYGWPHKGIDRYEGSEWS